MDPLTIGLLATTAISGGLNFLGQSQANKINQNNLAGGNIASLVANAEKAGINPLAVLGGSTGAGSPAQNVFADAPALGQNITRALAAASPEQQRLDALREQNLQLQNAQLHNDVVAGQMKNSAQANALGHPGTARGYVSNTPTPATMKVIFPDGHIEDVPNPKVTQGTFSMSPMGTIQAIEASSPDFWKWPGIRPDVARAAGSFGGGLDPNTFQVSP